MHLKRRYAAHSHCIRARAGLWRKRHTPGHHKTSRQPGILPDLSAHHSPNIKALFKDREYEK